MLLLLSIRFCLTTKGKPYSSTLSQATLQCEARDTRQQAARFPRAYNKHTGEHQGELIVEGKEYGIEHRIGYLVGDNITSNDVAEPLFDLVTDKVNRYTIRKRNSR